MANLSALTPLTTTATSLSNLILVTPQANLGYQPQNDPLADPTSQQPPTLLFHYEGEQSVSLESDITDHFIEDNTAIADQIALKPEVITTHGFIGELNDVPPKALAVIRTAAEKLTAIEAYVPELTLTADITYAQAFQLYQVAANAANSAISAWSGISGTGGENVIGSNGQETSNGNQTKQQVIFQQFYGYWKNRTLFTVQTPWAIFKNMAIKSLRAIQDAETRMITDFEVTFKIIRTASTLFDSGIQLTFQGRSAFQAARLTDLGTSTPVSSISLTNGLTNNFAASFTGF